MNQFARLDTLLSTDRVCNLIKYSTRCANIAGEMVEFGVYRGGSLEILAKFNPNKTIFGIDSFMGVPAPSNQDNYHKEGDFSDVDYAAISGYFKMLYPNVRIIRGFSPGVFNFFDQPGTAFSFVHVDVDMYQSVMDAIAFFWKRMMPGGMILFDDYGFGSTLGAKTAIDSCGVKGYELKDVDGLSNKQFIMIK